MLICTKITAVSKPKVFYEFGEWMATLSPQAHQRFELQVINGCVVVLKIVFISNNIAGLSKHALTTTTRSIVSILNHLKLSAHSHGWEVDHPDGRVLLS